MLPLLPSKAKPRLDHHGFREQGTQSAQIRLQKLEEKISHIYKQGDHLVEAVALSIEEINKHFKDAESLQEEALQELSHIKGFGEICTEIHEEFVITQREMCDTLKEYEGHRLALRTNDSQQAAPRNLGHTLLAKDRPESARSLQSHTSKVQNTGISTQDYDELLTESPTPKESISNYLDGSVSNLEANQIPHRDNQIAFDRNNFNNKEAVARVEENVKRGPQGTLSNSKSNPDPAHKAGVEPGQITKSDDNIEDIHSDNKEREMGGHGTEGPQEDGHKNEEQADTASAIQHRDWTLPGFSDNIVLSKQIQEFVRLMELTMVEQQRTGRINKAFSRIWTEADSRVSNVSFFKLRIPLSTRLIEILGVKWGLGAKESTAHEMLSMTSLFDWRANYLVAVSEHDNPNVVVRYTNQLPDVETPALFSLFLRLFQRLFQDMNLVRSDTYRFKEQNRKLTSLLDVKSVLYAEKKLEVEWLNRSFDRSPINHPENTISAGAEECGQSMHKQVPMPKSVYEAELGEGQFRVLIILPAPQSYYPLVCKLETWSLKTSRTVERHYAALSYCWGGEDWTGRIYLLSDGFIPSASEPTDWALATAKATEIRIRHNLFRALLRLRRHGTGAEQVALWVDFICINQTDPHEKTIQLSNMVNIYRNARNVCIWLGESDNEGRSDKAMEFIPEIMDFAVMDRYARDKKQAHKWFALSELMRDRWFSRRWVVQEIALSKSATVHCGGSMVWWSDFADAVSLLVSNQETIKSLFDFSDWREGHNTLGAVGSYGASILLEATNNLFLRKPNGDLKRPIKTIESLVTSLTTFDTGDTHDLIYSVVSIASDTSQHVDIWARRPDPPLPFILKSDYSKTAIEAYEDFTKFCVLSSQSLDIICRPWAMPVKNKDGKILDLPSWIRLLSDSEFGVPDEVYSGRKNGEGLVGPVGNPYYRASGVRNNVSAPETCQNSHDVSTSYGGYPISFPPGGSLIVAKGLKLAIIKDVSPRTTGGVILSESLKMLGWVRFGMHTDRVPDNVWRTLVADRGDHGEMPPSWYQRACLRCLEIADTFNNGDLNIGELLQGHSQMLHKYLVRVRNVTWNRRFFKAAVEGKDKERLQLSDGQPSKEGKTEDSSQERWDYGLCPPGSKKDDLVCILFGCSVPVILREVSDGRWILVGEAYVHGKMDGEAVEDFWENHSRDRLERFSMC